MDRQIRRPGFAGFILGVTFLVTVRSVDAGPAILSDTETDAVVATKYYNTFSSAHPVLKHVHPGAVIATKTLDAFGKDERDVERGPLGNPLTGPFYVDGAAPSSLISGSYGGNLDYNEIGPGAVVTLPVYHPGALLFVGDGHALQADGEPTGSGIETSMDVEFTLDVRKNSTLAGPRVETADDIMSIGSQPEFTSSLDRALQMATHDMVDWLVSEYQLEPWAAHLLIGYEGKYDVVTVAGSMALRIPKKFLPDRQSGNRAP